MARDCRKKRSESTSALEEKWLISKQSDEKPYQPDGKPGARIVQSSNLDPTNFLYSSDDDNDDDGTDEAQVANAPKKIVRVVHIEDKGSQPHKVIVNVRGVPVKGIIVSRQLSNTFRYSTTASHLNNVETSGLAH